MENHTQAFDVCIVFALPDEARAFLEVVRQQCEAAIEEHSSARYHYAYRFAIIKNNKDEPLTLHISWLPRYGPQEMTLHLSRVLEECQPRIAIMTGICAGDAQHVQLGDVVVAERTFTYDNGKFTLDDDGRKVHLHDTLTYQLDANILQFLGLFDDWKPLLTGLERPPSPPDFRLKRHGVRCHLKAMASGNAVRADNPFKDVQAPVRGTVAIDMEGAAFGLVMSRHPLTRWLVVKGVCDYADQNKNDAYHDYAARASALYTLSFIRAYVTNERLPRPDGFSSSSRAGPSGVWNVPHRRNPHFTGRDELLDRLHQQLTAAGQNDTTKTRRAALTQPQAIKGLGGIGKTQIAVEYAYRCRDLDCYMHVLWVNAATEEAVITSLTEIAGLLPSFSATDETDQRKLVEAIKRWLEQCEQQWLLIFDNADDLSLVDTYLPKLGNGSILLTTRANAVGSLAKSIEVEEMGLMEGTEFLLHRAQRLQHASDEERNEATNIVIAVDSFPLALDQAGAYIEETGCSLVDYLQIYQNHRKELLARRGLQHTNYPDAVATTWSLSFQKVEQANPAAAELLHLCAFLAPDRIPEELIREGAPHWNSPLQQAVADPFTFNQVVEELLKFSLVERLTEERTLRIHRLVQAVQMDMMELVVQRQWAERVVHAVNEVFPHDAQDTTTWPQCLRYLEQAQACDALIRQHTLALIEAADLLNRTGLYLKEHASYTIAEPLYQLALRIWEQQLGPEHPQVAYPLNNLALLYHTQGKYAEAELLYLRALRIWEQQLGPEHPNVATVFGNLAEVYRAQGKYAEAEPLYQQALYIREQQLGPEYPRIATVLNNLAELYREQGKYAEAEPLYQRALQIEKQQLGSEHRQVAYPLNNLANLYVEQGKYAEAEPLYQQALYIREQQLGPEHPDVAVGLNNLAELYRAQGNYAEAKSFYRRALQIWEKHEHPHVAQPLNGLAGLYIQQGNYAEAEPLIQKALQIEEQQLGPEHPYVVSVLHNLAELYQKQGKYAEAEPFYLRALQIGEQQLGPEHPQVAYSLNNLALLYHTQGKYAKAKPFYLRALQIWEQQLGPKHPDVATVLDNLANLYRGRGKYAEAEPFYQRELQIWEQQLGPDHLQVATTLNYLADLYREQEKYAEAEPLYQRALYIIERQLGPDHPNLAPTFNNLAELYRKQEKYAEAEPLYQRALRIGEHQGPEHLDIAYPLNNLATLYRAQGKYAEAEPLYQRALQIGEQQLGPEHPFVQATRKNYASLLRSIGRDEEAKKMEERL